MPAATSDYIPPKDQDLDAWAANFSTVISASPTAYGLLAAQATAFATLKTAFATALAIATAAATRSSVTIATKDTARASLVLSARQLGQIAQTYPAITPALLTTAGLTVPSTVPTPVPAPVTVPLLSLISSIGNVLTISFSDELTPSSKRKPSGVIQLEVVGVFSTTPPAQPEICPPIATTGRWPMRIDAGSTNAGKTAYIYARWQTRRGLKGPWSAQLTALVQP